LLGFRAAGASERVIGSNQSPGDGVPSPSAEPPSVATPGVLPVAAPVAAVAPAVPRPSPVRRFFEWFWLGRAMAELRAQGRIGSPRALELLRRAWRSLELAERALSPVPRLLNGAADAEARELARQGLFWALAAESVLRREASHATSGDGATPLASRSLRELWAEAEPSLLVAAAGSEGGVHAVEAALRVDGFADFAELSAEEQARQARDLVAFVRSLGAVLETPRVSLDRLWTRRMLRTGLGVVVVGALLGGAIFARSQQDNARDWARGRPYKPSSAFPVPVCKSPDQECPESPFFFFHTMEEDRPSLEIDLGAKRRFSAVRIANREDCCADRAVPLVVEVSNDHTKWHEVARRTETFNTWYAEFAPTSARYVRVATTRKSVLHLHRVAVLR